MVLSNWLEIYKKIICWWQIESCAIECWVYHCEVTCLVFSIVLELSMKLRNNKDIAIEPIWFNKEHNPAIVCLLNQCLVCTDNIFTIPLVGGVWDRALPNCIFSYKKIPLVVNDLLVGSAGTAVFIWWANPIVHNRILKWLWCCTIGAINLLLTCAGLIRKWDWLITTCWLSIIIIAQTLSTSAIKTCFAVVIWEICRFYQSLQNKQLEYTKQNSTFECI